MTTTHRDIESFLAGADLLKLVEGRWFYADSNMVHDANSTSLSADELIAYEPRLRSVLAQLAMKSAAHWANWREEERQGCPVVSAKLVRATLDLWNDKVVKIGDTQDPIYSRDVLQILAGKSSKRASQLSISLLECFLACCKDASGNEIVYVSHQQRMTHKISHKDLEETFPEWKQRYLVAQSLGYEGLQLAQTTFLPKNQQMPVSVKTPTLPQDITLG